MRRLYFSQARRCAASCRPPNCGARHGKHHTDRWDRALLAFGETVEDATLTPLTAAEAQAFADRGSAWHRWVSVADALRDIESNRQQRQRQEQQQQEQQQQLATSTVETDPQDADPPDRAPTADGKYAGLIAQMYEWREDPQWRHQKSHTDRWDRALLAFGETVSDATLTPMTAAEAQGYADTAWGARWVPVAAALWEIEGG